MDYLDEAERALRQSHLEDHEILASLIAWEVWRRLDYSDALWRTTFTKKLGRFESRLIAAGNQPDATRFLYRFATLCHVNPQDIDPRVAARTKALDADGHRKLLRTARDTPGLITTCVRLISENLKKERDREKSGG